MILNYFHINGIYEFYFHQVSDDDMIIFKEWFVHYCPNKIYERHPYVNNFVAFYFTENEKDLAMLFTLTFKGD